MIPWEKKKMKIDRMVILIEGKNENGLRTGTIMINGDVCFECNLDWIPKYYCDINDDLVPVHAIQWYGDHGEIELTTRGSNIIITELGILETAISYFEERKLELQEETNRLEQESRKLEEERISWEKSLQELSEREHIYFDQLLNELLESDANSNADIN
jgi:hypothetical protein